ncbi:MAG: hypothetical protein H7A23_06085 [Leptospiraceae bacterium]|nr:hypothetical protein [Leptospiraceae bacterium]MCP5494108.1 hypothetical protein [Leptospiraceae bacterium]
MKRVKFFEEYGLIEIEAKVNDFFEENENFELVSVDYQIRSIQPCHSVAVVYEIKNEKKMQNSP